jgi:hypothetical protein
MIRRHSGKALQIGTRLVTIVLLAVICAGNAPDASILYGSTSSGCWDFPAGVIARNLPVCPIVYAHGANKIGVFFHASKYGAFPASSASLTPFLSSHRIWLLQTTVPTLLFTASGIEARAPPQNLLLQPQQSGK